MENNTVYSRQIVIMAWQGDKSAFSILQKPIKNVNSHMTQTGVQSNSFYSFRFSQNFERITLSLIISTCLSESVSDQIILAILQAREHWMVHVLSNLTDMQCWLVLDPGLAYASMGSFTPHIWYEQLWNQREKIRVW